MFTENTHQNIGLFNHGVSANLNLRQRSHLDKLVREWQALKGGLKSPDLAKNYDLGLIRKIKAKQEEIKEFLRTQEMEEEKTLAERKEEIREQLMEWAHDEAGKNYTEAKEWVDKTFQIDDNEQIITKGDLTLNYCKKLLRLPNNLHITGSLSLCGCENFEAFPDDLVFSGKNVSLRWCKRLKKLPVGFHVRGYLKLDSCESLVALPDDLVVDGDFLNLVMCEKLTRLPAKFHIMGDVYLSNCESLEHLPGDTYIENDLYIEGCKDAIKQEAKELKAQGKIKGEIYE